jgi:hemerythrin
MAYWQWGPELELGIDVIDQQHRRIVEYMNELHDAMMQKNDEAVGRVIEALVDYTLTHFAFEESLMEKGGYPLTEPHRAVHENFTRQIHRYREEHQNGAEVAKKLLSSLRVWLTNHISRYDRDYVAAVKQRLDEHQKSGWVHKTLKRLFG